MKYKEKTPTAKKSQKGIALCVKECSLDFVAATKLGSASTLQGADPLVSTPVHTAE